MRLAPPLQELSTGSTKVTDEVSAVWPRSHAMSLQEIHGYIVALVCFLKLSFRCLGGPVEVGLPFASSGGWSQCQQVGRRHDLLGRHF